MATLTERIFAMIEVDLTITRRFGSCWSHYTVYYYTGERIVERTHFTF